MEALVNTASIKLLRELIAAGGLSDAGIVEKSELRELAVRACGTAPSASLASLMQDAGTEALRKVLDDPASTAGQRDFARMRLAEEQPLPAPAQQGDIACSGDRVFTGESLSRNQRLEKAVQDWKAADAFDDQDMRDARAAVHRAAAAILVDEKRLPIRSRGDPRAGQCDALGAYPRLVAAATSIIADTKAANPLRADAHVLLGLLHSAAAARSEPSSRAAREHYGKAVKLRPGHSRQLYLLSAMSAMAGLTARALEELLMAREAATDTLERWSYGSMIARCLMGLSPPRYADALRELEEHAEGPGGDLLDGLVLERGHMVESLYHMVTCSHMLEGRVTSKAKEAYRRAEAQEKGLPAQVRARMDPTVKMSAQAVITSSQESVRVGSSRECHGCHQPKPDLKLCTGCLAVAYCSQACQKAAWKAGHKNECARKQASREQVKDDARGAKACHTEIGQLPPVDADLEPAALWRDAVRQSGQGAHDEAVWLFMLALFMDYSLDANDMAPLKRSLAGCSDPHSPPAVAVRPIAETAGLKTVTLAPWEQAYTELRRRAFKRSPTPPRTLEDVSRAALAACSATLFLARTLGRMGAVRADQPGDQGAFNDAYKLISEAAELVHAERFMTLQFELGYASRDILAHTESNAWYDKLQASAPRRPNQHWTTQLRLAKQSADMTRMLLRMQGLAGLR